MQQITNAQYIHDIKQKVESLILRVAKAGGVFLSDKKRYRINYNMHRLEKNDKLYNCYKSGKRINGTFYGPNFSSDEPSDFEDWMEDNFPDLVYCIDVYEKILKSQVFQEDLKELNRIHKEYE